MLAKLWFLIIGRFCKHNYEIIEHSSYRTHKAFFGQYSQEFTYGYIISKCNKCDNFKWIKYPKGLD